MRTIDNPNKKDWNQILQRPTKTVDDIEKTVHQIFDDIQRNGDTSVEKYTQLFDGVVLKDSLVSSDEIKEAVSLVSEKLKEAIEVAKKKILQFFILLKKRLKFL
jgi:histidinol dehydrogenase